VASYDERMGLLSVNPRYDSSRHLNQRPDVRALLAVENLAQIFTANWQDFRSGEKVSVPRLKGQEGRAPSATPGRTTIPDYSPRRDADHNITP
jgi:hypothetical protein